MTEKKRKKRKAKTKLTPAPLKAWWVSWWHDPIHGGYELHSPWWRSGADDTRTSVCAAVHAPTEEAARDIIRRSYDEMPANVEFRFVEEKPADWSPFNGRFQRADWMVW